MEHGYFACFNDSFGIIIPISPVDVVGDSVGKEKVNLGDKADEFSQGGEWIASDVPAIKQD